VIVNLDSWCHGPGGNTVWLPQSSEPGQQYNTVNSQLNFKQKYKTADIL